MAAFDNEWWAAFYTRHEKRCGNCTQIKRMGRCSGLLHFKEDHEKGCDDWEGKEDEK